MPEQVAYATATAVVEESATVSTTDSGSATVTVTRN